jgi:mannose-6-phosphate isomerase-like protein (cupin superfamily)
MMWQICWNFDELKDFWPYRTPDVALDCQEYIQSSDAGSIQLLVSPNTAITRTLHVSVVTVAPDCELPSNKAMGVEFYYVISGIGSFSQRGLTERQSLTAGLCFVVDAGSMRWISNGKGNEDDLILLRATDGGNRYSNGRVDKIRHDPNHKVEGSTATSTVGKLTKGIRKVQERAKDYYRSKPNSHSQSETA